MFFSRKEYKISLVIFEYIIAMIAGSGEILAESIGIMNNVAKDNFAEVLKWLSHINLPSLMQGVGLALLTILIPLAIAILEDILKKKRELRKKDDGIDEGKDKKKNQNIGFVDLDIRLGIDDIFPIKVLAPLTVIFFIAVIFITSNFLFFILIGTFYVLYLAYLLWIILGSYKWIQGDFFKFRLRHLKKLKEAKDLEICWRSVWDAKDIPPQQEEQYFEIFIGTLNNLVIPAKAGIQRRNKKTSNFSTIATLLNDFHSLMKNRSPYFLVFSFVVLQEILKLHHKFWRNRLDGKKYDYCENICASIDDILERFERESIEKKQFVEFLTPFKEHVEKHLEETKKDVENRRGGIMKFPFGYLGHLFSIFYPSVFKNINNINTFAAFNPEFGYFPPECIVTTERLEGENILSLITLKEFCNFIEVKNRGVIVQNNTITKNGEDEIIEIFFPGISMEDIKQLKKRYITQ